MRYCEFRVDVSLCEADKTNREDIHTSIANPSRYLSSGLGGCSVVGPLCCSSISLEIPPFLQAFLRVAMLAEGCLEIGRLMLICSP
jgi:hypothetical protein